MNRNLLLLPILFLTLHLCACKDSNTAGSNAGQKLNATGEISSEIQQAYKIECHPYYRIAEDVGQIEMHLSDRELDHQSIATEVSQLQSVRSFHGKLHLVFRYPADASVTPTLWVKYDAKSGIPLEK